MHDICLILHLCNQITQQPMDWCCHTVHCRASAVTWLCCAALCCVTVACYGVMCTLAVACNARCQAALSDTLGHYHNESRPHAVHVWLVQGLLVRICSGESAVLGGEAVQQGLHAFLTNSTPCATPNAPPLRVRTLCWVRNQSAPCYISSRLA